MLFEPGGLLVGVAADVAHPWLRVIAVGGVHGYKTKSLFINGSF